MNGIHAKEYIEQHHPDMPLVQMISLINEAQRDFCNKTHIYKASYTDTTSAGQRYYTLPDNVIKILKVQFNDVDIPRLQGDPIIDDDELTATNPIPTPSTSSTDRYWYESLGRIGVVEKVGATTSAVERDDKKSKYQSVSVSSELRVYALSSPADLTTANYKTTNILSGVPGGHERAILDYVIAQGYIIPANLNPELSQIFDTKYELAVKQARKIATARGVTDGK